MYPQICQDVTSCQVFLAEGKNEKEGKRGQGTRKARTKEGKKKKRGVWKSEEGGPETLSCARNQTKFQISTKAKDHPPKIVTLKTIKYIYKHN